MEQVCPDPRAGRLRPLAHAHTYTAGGDLFFQGPADCRYSGLDPSSFHENDNTSAAFYATYIACAIVRTVLTLAMADAWGPSGRATTYARPIRDHICPCQISRIDRVLPSYI